jgi:hypothetical protein
MMVHFCCGFALGVFVGYFAAYHYELKNKNKGD